MFTVCPKCALTLVVTPADLKVGQGYVRCGRCSNVFNALVGLTDDRRQSSKAAVPEASAGGELDTEAVPDSALEFHAESTDVAEVFIEPRPGPHDVASGTFETIVLELDESEPRAAEAAGALLEGSLSDDSAMRVAAADAANDSDAETLRAANDASVTHGPAIARPQGFDRQRIEQPRVLAAPAGPPADAPDAVELITRVPRSRGALVAWGSASLLLLLLLAAQLVHENRATLAVDARFRAPLTSIYDTLGLALIPRWDLSGYDVRQLGATAGAGEDGLLTVRASVQNGGANPQPLPLLRVTVQDRFGNRIAARDVTPASYAGRVARETPLLAAGERVDAEIRLADPGSDAVGFELDACLPVEGGAIACANEQLGR